MRTKITTSLGYSLLMTAAVVGAIFAKSSVDLSEIAQFMVLAAGAVSLMLMTRTRPSK